MKKTLVALTALFVLTVSAAFAAEGAACCGKAKEAQSCDKDKAACPTDTKDAKPAPAPSTEKKS